jgi:hypothetical protein
MKRFFPSYAGFFTKRRVRSFILGILLLAVSFFLQGQAATYSTRSAGPFVGDIFLDNLPVVNLNFIIIEGALAAILFSVILLLMKPSYLLFALKATALLVITRAFFISLTHLGIYPGQVVPSDGFSDKLYIAFDLQAGYFFSSHTGLPFLIALIFWNERLWRFVFFSISAIFAISVLFAHVHYSIDVFAAPFIAYGVFKAAQYLFPEDYELIRSAPSVV